MRIVNKTPYRMGDLSALVRAALKAEGVDPKGYVVEIGPSKRRRYHRWGSQPDTATLEQKHQRELGFVSGLGRYYSKWIRLGIPKEWFGRDLARDEIEVLASVAVHEIAHNRGVRHPDMTFDARYSDVVHGSWAERLVVRLAVKEVVVKQDVREKRAAHAKKMLEVHSKRLGREKNLVKRWEAKVRYYERVLGDRAAAPGR